MLTYAWLQLKPFDNLCAPGTPRYREVYDLIIETLRLKTDDTFPIPAWLAKMAFAPRVSWYTATAGCDCPWLLMSLCQPNLLTLSLAVELLY